MLTLYFKIALLQLKSEGTEISVSRIIFRAFILEKTEKTRVVCSKAPSRNELYQLQPSSVIYLPQIYHRTLTVFLSLSETIKVSSNSPVFFLYWHEGLPCFSKAVGFLAYEHFFRRNSNSSAWMVLAHVTLCFSHCQSLSASKGLLIRKKEKNSAHHGVHNWNMGKGWMFCHPPVWIGSFWRKRLTCISWPMQPGLWLCKTPEYINKSVLDNTCKVLYLQNSCVTEDWLELFAHSAAVALSTDHFCTLDTIWDWCYIREFSLRCLW